MRRIPAQWFPWPGYRASSCGAPPRLRRRFRAPDAALICTLRVSHSVTRRRPSFHRLPAFAIALVGHGSPYLSSPGAASSGYCRSSLGLPFASLPHRSLHPDRYSARLAVRPYFHVYFQQKGTSSRKILLYICASLYARLTLSGVLSHSKKGVKSFDLTPCFLCAILAARFGCVERTGCRK